MSKIGRLARCGYGIHVKLNQDQIMKFRFALLRTSQVLYILKPGVKHAWVTHIFLAENCLQVQVY